MSFIPGSRVTTFTTKTGKQAVLAYPKWEDLDALLQFINQLSAENTYILMSGKQLDQTQEAEYLASVFVGMELKKMVKVLCWIDGELAGSCEVSNVTNKMDRSPHVARFGISVAQKFRGEGIGQKLAETTIEQARKELSGLKIVLLECFADNAPAINLYKKIGFVQTGLQPGILLHNNQQVDEIEMALTLTQS